MGYYEPQSTTNLLEARTVGSNMAHQIYEGWLENLNMRNPLLIHYITTMADDTALVWCEQAHSVGLGGDA